MSTCEHEDGCEYDAVFDTHRCLPHQPDHAGRATSHLGYHGAYQHGRPINAWPAEREPKPEPRSVAEPRPEIPALAEAKQAAEDAGFGEPDAVQLLGVDKPGEPVSFTEPVARGWLTRALERIFR